MKKVVLALVLATFLVTGAAFADHPGGLGIGLQGGYPLGGALSLKLPSMPIFWAITASGGDNGMGIGLTGDFYFIDANLVGWLNWYFGLGGSVGVWLGDSVGLGVGARLPIGLSFQIPVSSGITCLELYIQAAPTLGINILPEFDLPGYGGWWNGAGGIRLWFK